MLQTTLDTGCSAYNKTKVTYYRAFGLRDEFSKTKHASMHCGHAHFAQWSLGN